MFKSVYVADTSTDHARWLKWLSVEHATTSQLMARNSSERSLKAMISVGQTKVLETRQITLVRTLLKAPRCMKDVKHTACTGPVNTLDTCTCPLLAQHITVASIGAKPKKNPLNLWPEAITTVNL